jgi:CPA2 family monovalent cation:H+ antiporter-2
MHLDPAMPLLVGTALAILIVGLVLRSLRQPHVVAYLLTGVFLGHHGIALITGDETISRLGVIGVDLLLFFVGMEISPRRLFANWKIAVVGTLLQVGVSVGCMWLLGVWFGWPLERVVLLGFVISLSSTAVVIKLLQDWGELDTVVGRNAVTILLAQDMVIIPMLIGIGLMRGGATNLSTLGLQLTGGVLLVALVVWMSLKSELRLPLGKILREDREMQVFGAAVVCLGLSFVTGLLGLSTALGAFVGGMVVGLARETDWVHRSLEPFRVVFVALFFVGVGLLVDLDFIVANWRQVALMVAAVFVMNTLINAAVLRLFGNTWRESVYGGALLAQIGEFSFVLAAVGYQISIIGEFSYDATIAVIALSLLLSPAWIGLFRRMQTRV